MEAGRLEDHFWAMVEYGGSNVYTRRAGGSEDLMPIRYQDELEVCNSARKLSHTSRLAGP
jgi:hypothetical protein